MVKTKNCQNGEIYRIVDNAYTMCYIGSTIDKLSNRLNSHKSKYKKYFLRRHNHTTVYDILDTFGIDKGKIEEIEKYPCNDKHVLFAREGQHIKNTDCVSKVIAGRTIQEYREDNSDKLNEYHKNWTENNKEHNSIRRNTTNKTKNKLKN